MTLKSEKPALNATNDVEMPKVLTRRDLKAHTKPGPKPMKVLSKVPEHAKVSETTLNERALELDRKRADSLILRRQEMESHMNATELASFRSKRAQLLEEAFAMKEAKMNNRYIGKLVLMSIFFIVELNFFLNQGFR